MNDYKGLKTNLLNHCIERQQNMVETAREAMRAVQESAITERSHEDLTDSFSAQCQNDHSMYARRLHEASGVLTILERAKTINSNPSIDFGSVVITDKMNFFVAASIGQFDLEGEKFFVISTQTPIYEAMVGKQAGDKFTFRNTTYKIKDVS